MDRKNILGDEWKRMDLMEWDMLVSQLLGDLAPDSYFFLSGHVFPLDPDTSLQDFI